MLARAGSVQFLARLGATARWRGKNTVLVPIVDFYNIISWESTLNSIRKEECEELKMKKKEKHVLVIDFTMLCVMMYCVCSLKIK